MRDDVSRRKDEGLPAYDMFSRLSAATYASTGRLFGYGGLRLQGPKDAAGTERFKLGMNNNRQ